MILVTIAGTWAARKHEGWHEWNSPFWKYAREKGLRTADVPVRRGVLRSITKWSTDLEGIWAENDTWEQGGQAARWYIDAYCRDDTIVVAHSHGGQVAAYALADPPLPQVKRLVTIGTPVRKDMMSIYEQAARNVEKWCHMFSSDDWWQMFGTLGDGSWFKKRRTMPHASMNLKFVSLGHSGILDPKVWKNYRLWGRVQD